MGNRKAYDAVMALAEPRTKQAATQEQLDAMKRLSGIGGGLLGATGGGLLGKHLGGQVVEQFDDTGLLDRIFTDMAERRKAFGESAGGLLGALAGGGLGGYAGYQVPTALAGRGSPEKKEKKDEQKTPKKDTTQITDAQLAALLPEYYYGY